MIMPIEELDRLLLGDNSELRAELVVPAVGFADASTPATNVLAPGTAETEPDWKKHTPPVL